MIPDAVAPNRPIRNSHQDAIGEEMLARLGLTFLGFGQHIVGVDLSSLAAVALRGNLDGLRFELFSFFSQHRCRCSAKFRVCGEDCGWAKFIRLAREDCSRCIDESGGGPGGAATKAAPEEGLGSRGRTGAALPRPAIAKHGGNRASGRRMTWCDSDRAFWSQHKHPGGSSHDTVCWTRCVAEGDKASRA
jgi:hypothetical protein